MFLVPHPGKRELAHLDFGCASYPRTLVAACGGPIFLKLSTPTPGIERLQHLAHTPRPSADALLRKSQNAYASRSYMSQKTSRRFWTTHKIGGGIFYLLLILHPLPGRANTVENPFAKNPAPSSYGVSDTWVRDTGMDNGAHIMCSGVCMDSTSHRHPYRVLGCSSPCRNSIQLSTELAQECRQTACKESAGLWRAAAASSLVDKQAAY